jgi:chemotaxis protein methyltransferase CheR
MNRYEIGIVETRNVIKALLDTYGYDFRDFALTSFKRRLEDIIAKNGLKDADGLVFRLQNNKDFFELFLKDILPETTEMFRDPSMWRALREDIIPDIVKSTSKLKVWVAAFDSGEELYSLCILLQEMNLLEKFQIFASTISDDVTKKIQSGKLDIKQLEVNEANYERFVGKTGYSKYYNHTSYNGSLNIDTSIISSVTFTRQDTLLSSPPSGMKLVLFRNQLIYFNPILQDKTLSSVHNSLVPNGYLVLGTKETLENTNSGNKFTLVNESEQIYKKKSG